jgi:CheY-like chemotaxis protein
LLNLINDILDLSKIEAGRMEITCEDLSVARSFGEIVSVMRPLAEKKSQTLHSSADAALGVHADPMRFTQVLMNLVGNAVKFTPENGRIELTARAIDAEVQVRVSDNGPGIPAEEQNRIFEAFCRLRKSGQAVEGTGLGLAITNSLVRLQGGSLSLESAPGQGSCFYFSFPAASDISMRAASAAKGAIHITSPAEILVIEDDCTAIQLIESQLTSAGCQVVFCIESERALEIAVQEQPQAITLDLLMKPTSGLEVLLQLKKDTRTANIPVIVVSIVDHPNALAALGLTNIWSSPLTRPLSSGQWKGASGEGRKVFKCREFSWSRMTTPHVT